MQLVFVLFLFSVLSYVSLSSLAPAANIWFSFNAYGHYTAIDLFSRYMANYFTYLVLFTMHKAQINYTRMQRRMCFGAWWVWNMCGKTCWTDNLAISLCLPPSSSCFMASLFNVQCAHAFDSVADAFRCCISFCMSFSFSQFSIDTEYGMDEKKSELKYHITKERIKNARTYKNKQR